MKKIVLSLIVGSILFANEPAPDMNAMANMMYQKMKEATLPMSKGMIVNMSEAKKCFQNANNKAEAEKCADKLDKDSQKAQNDISTAFGIDKATVEAEKKKQRGEFDKTKWTPQEKNKIITQLDKAIKQGTISTKCMEENKDFLKFRECMKKNGLDKIGK